MSGISSGVGLVTGINSSSLIDQLIAIEQKPVDSLKARVQAIDTTRTAFLGISAQLLAVKNAITNFNQLSFFTRFNATSSNDQVITATAADNAVPSTTTFRVRSLVASHSLIGRGFATADSTPVGAGTISIEVGHGRVNDGTRLDQLNGGAGVGRGVISITDRNGHTAQIDLSTAVTIQDVMDAINSNTNIDVTARVTGIPSYDVNGNQILGDRVILEDNSGGTGNLIVTDIGSGTTAADLGIAANAAASRIDGHDLVRLTEATPLSLLNDGNGIGGAGGVLDKKDLTFTSTTEGSFDVSLSSLMSANTDSRLLNAGGGVSMGVVRITDRAGHSVNVDLSDLNPAQGVTVGQITDRINQAAKDAGVAVTVSYSAATGTKGDRNFFIVNDASTVPAGSTAQLKIEDLQGTTAGDLGIAGASDTNAITGKNVYSVTTLGDVVRAINYAAGNSFVTASLSNDGNGIVLSAQGFDNQVTVTAADNGNGSTTSAARDLGLEGATFSTSGDSFQSRSLIAGLDTVLLQTLNGGSGVTAGQVSLTDRSGATTTIDLGSAQTMQDVIDLINADGTTSIRASVNAAGSGLQLKDTSGGAGNIVVSDTTGSLATDLGIAGTYAPSIGNVVDGGNAQRQYITEGTQLSSLNLGQGVAAGTIKITTADGAIRTVQITEADRTVGDVIKKLKNAGLSAQINNTGDGILITDNTEGTGRLAIEDANGGSTATDLRIAKQAAYDTNTIDGSYETHIQVSANDSLQTVAQKINDAGIGVSASVIHDGSATTPYSLTLTSDTTGLRGRLTIDTGSIDLGLRTLSAAQDAVVTIGDAGGTTRLITSSSNSLDKVVDGVTFNLLATSNEPVTVNVAQDVDSIVQSINNFVDQYNKTLDTIDQGDTFNQDTYQRGPLFGDFAVDQIQNRMRQAVLGQVQNVDPALSRMFDVGLKVGTSGRLEFDEQKFRDVYQQNPQKVEDLFAHKDTGFGTVMQNAIDDLTRDTDGLLAKKDQLLQDQQGILNKRIDELNVLIDAKRARLEAQFASLESAVAALQAQQGALSNLASGQTGG